MVYHFESNKNHLLLQLPNKQNVEFVGKTFVTDSEETATQIRSTRTYASGGIYEIDGEIAQAKPQRKKFRVQSGGVGTDTK